MLSSVAGRIPQVIVLNGASSSGKSSLARELQRRLDDVWFHVSVDAFLDMLPLEDETKGAQLAAEFPRLLHAIHASMGALADGGARVIIDHVLAPPLGADDLRAVLDGIDTMWVGLLCPLDVLDERELARGDRQVGMARLQATAVHDGMAYELTVDTSRADASGCANQILIYMDGRV